MAASAPTASSPTSSKAKALAAFLAISVAAGALVAGIGLPFAVAAGRTSNGTVDAFNALPSDLETQPLSQQSKILYADGSTMATFYYENRIEVPLDQVAPVMQQAIVAIEDSRYWQHGGVDPKGIARAIVNNASGDDVQGASTLTQQWIKNVNVEKAVSALPTNATTAERTKAFQSATASTGIKGYTRKLREIKLAIAAEKKYSKKQILDNYLNITSFGDAQYGVEAASEHYFDLHAKDLPLEDAALLAGIVNNPITYDPVTNPANALSRRNTVLDKMLKQGLISQADHDRATAITIAQQLHVQPMDNGCTQAGGAAFFCDYAVKQFATNNAFGGTQASRLKELYRGGLTITTTLDRQKEDAAVGTVNSTVPWQSSTSRPQKLPDGKTSIPAETLGAALDSVEPGTGKILAMAQNRTYDTSADAPVGSTSVNYSTDKASGGSSGFQTGSTSKAFTLAAWLNDGHTLNETVDADVKTFPNTSWKFGACSSSQHYTSKPYAPGNASDGEGSANMSVLDATVDSVNTAFAQMSNEMQLCDIQAVDNALGVHEAGDGSPIPVRPSMTLGVETVSPLTVAAAYAAFADQGTFCTPIAITKITDADGKALTVPASKCSQAMSADVANGVTYALQQVITRGTADGQDLAGGRTAAGKTGTTNRSVATWFTGYTPQLATSVWIGTPAGSADTDGATVAGRRIGKMYGATVAAPLWKDYMNAALTGQPDESFTGPPSSLIGSAPAPASRPSSKPSSGSSRSRSGSTPTRSAAPATRAPTQAPTTQAPTTQAPAPQPPAPAPTAGPQTTGDSNP